ncbi:C25 family cysteine peptidase [Nocardioides zhouii]|uniref:Uncharacterized protein n=1 Tax=Nocardioides zhouii TaxID=1168729 RepID=A0A4Q2SKS1_9ACTN|nr:C25 family cysteine peptidase [Nocardioides zhouii]RYC05753.1 hypothetical protein EUA94_17795 [Nocardioides zhouii]
MKPRRITLVDLGLDSGFDASMTFVQGVLQNVNAGYEEPVIEIEFIRSRDMSTIREALSTPTDVLHVMAHGDHSEEPTFVSSDEKTQVSLPALANQMLDQGAGIAAPVVVADGCKTGIGVWQKAVRDCLQGPITYIGTSRLLYWHESTVFCSAFYGALTRNKGKGKGKAEQGMDAATRAIDAYVLITDKPSGFKAVTLTPSRRASKSLR